MVQVGYSEKENTFSTNEFQTDFFNSYGIEVYSDILFENEVLDRAISNKFIIYVYVRTDLHRFHQLINRLKHQTE